MSTIRPIGLTDVHRICSGQVIIDLCTGVKELVENALDANATKIEVRLFNFGFDSFEVIDDGTGISLEGRETACLKHWTSKLQHFDDLPLVSSFGFRGEALSSLCECAGSLSIVTRCATDETASKLSYDNAGHLVSTIVAARGIGTTVTVSGLFEKFPVRRKELEKNLKKHYSNLLLLMQAYGIICRGVRISVTNHQRDGKKVVALATPGAASLGPNLASVFGHKSLEELTPVEFEFNLRAPLNRSKTVQSLISETEEDRLVLNEENEADDAPDKESQTSSGVTSLSSSRQPIEVKISGFVSKARAGIGRSSTDRQFFFVNGRPVDLKKFSKALNDVWRQYEMNHKPACALNVSLPPGSFDVNLTPDKREILIERESEILEAFKEQLNEVWEPSRRTFDKSLSDEGSVARAKLDEIATPVEDAGTMRPSPQLTEDSRRQRKVAAKANPVSSLKRHIMGQTETPDSSTSIKSLEETIEGAGSENNEVEEVSENNIPERDCGTLVERFPDIGSIGSLSTREAPAAQSLNTETPRLERPTDEELSRFSSSSAVEHIDGEFRRKETKDAPRDDIPADRTLLMDGEGNSKRARIQKLDDTGAYCADHVVKQKVAELGAEGSVEECGCCGKIEPFPVDASQISITLDSRREDVDITNSPAGRVQASTNAHLSLELPSTVAELFQLEASAKHARVPERTSGSGEGDLFADADLAADEVDAVASLSRLFNKSDFERAEIVGQFNLGFIVARVQDELFVLDQHASDEKYRFESLQKTTTIEEQPLISPLTIEVSATEAQIIRDYEYVFSANGFHFADLHGQVYDEDVQIADGYVMQPNAIKLTRIPLSKQTLFGVEDVRELASIIRDDPPISKDRIPRLPKLRTMFASRACRSAIMVGDALPPVQMARVVSNLAKLEQPWNCPHGRPTMRHLVHLPELASEAHPSLDHT